MINDVTHPSSINSFADAAYYNKLHCICAFVIGRYFVKCMNALHCNHN